MSQELLSFLAILGVFVLSFILLKVPSSIAMVLAAIAGALVAGVGFPLRHLVEGTFTYLHTIETIVTAMIFMKVFENSGAFDAIVYTIIKNFHKRPTILLLCLMVVLMFPSMITGSSATSVLSAGALIIPVLTYMGIPPLKVAAIVAFGAILGKAAPPVNIPAMVIGTGADIPYHGFELPLLFIVIPLAIFSVLFLGLKYVRNVDYDSIKDKISTTAWDTYGFKLYIPLIVLVLLVILTKVMKVVPDIGLSAIFLLCAVVSCFTGKKTNFFISSREGIRTVINVMGNLMGAGMLIQIMTLIGVRGLLVTTTLTQPTFIRYLAMVTIVPVFGGISSFASASVFGTPFVLAFLGHNVIIVTAALSMITAVGDIMPPSALAGNFAVKLTGIKKYSEFLKACIIPAIVTLLWSLLVIIFAEPIGKLLGV
jgi:TRAP-type C4-dicarboxylate transport system permease large subunit